MKFKPTRISLRRPRKRVVIIISIAVVLTGLITYGVFSYLHWKSYDQDSQKAATSLKSVIDGSLSAEKKTPKASNRIDTIVKDFTKTYGENPCQPSGWFGWQTILPQLKAMRTTCDQRFEAALGVINTLKPLSQFFKDEDKAQKVVADALEATKSTTDYTAAKNTWHDASESGELSKRDNIKKTTTKIKEVANAISTAYNNLVTAMTKEDKAAFDAALKDLETGYAGIDELKVVANDEQTDVIKTFVKAYEKL